MKASIALSSSLSEINPGSFGWTDDLGLVHACESSEPIGTELLVWTLCDREVESGAVEPGAHSGAVTCSKCKAAILILERRASAPASVRPSR
jgi:hypothetical protein